MGRGVGRAPNPQGVKMTKPIVVLTNAEVIRMFLPVEIQVDGPLGGPATIQVRPRPGNATAPCTHAAAAPPESADRAESALLRDIHGT